MENKIKSIKGFWIVVNEKGEPQWTTVNYGMKESVKDFLENTSNKDWKFWKSEYGYRCVKVNIHFEEIAKPKSTITNQ